MIHPIRPTNFEYRSKMAKRLRSQGFTIRQIMQIMDYKSPRSVHVLLK